MPKLEVLWILHVGATRPNKASKVLWDKTTTSIFWKLASALRIPTAMEIRNIINND